MAPQKRKKLSDRFYSILQKMVREIDQEAIEIEVKSLRKMKPRASRRELAMLMTRKAAAKTATIGAAAGGTPGPFSLVVLAPDIFNLVRQQSRLVLSIAFLYDQRPDVRTRFREVLATLAIASGASATKKATQYLIARRLQTVAARRLAQRIVGRYLSRRVAAAAAPAIGFVVGGAVNYLSVRAVGIAAQKYYSGLLRQQQTTRRRQGRRVPRTTSAARSSRPSSRTRHAP